MQGLWLDWFAGCFGRVEVRRTAWSYVEGPTFLKHGLTPLAAAARRRVRDHSGRGPSPAPLVTQAGRDPSCTKSEYPDTGQNPSKQAHVTARVRNKREEQADRNQADAYRKLHVVSPLRASTLPGLAQRPRPQKCSATRYAVPVGSAGGASWRSRAARSAR